MSLKTFIPVVALLAIASGPPLGPPLGLRKPADGSQAIARRELRLGPQLLAPFAGVTLAAQSQPLTRRAANISLLATYPSFYHMRPITVVGQLSRTPTGEMLLTDDKRQLRVVYSGSAPEGSVDQGRRVIVREVTGCADVNNVLLPFSHAVNRWVPSGCLGV